MRFVVKQPHEKAPAFTEIRATGDTMMGLDQWGRVWIFLPKPANLGAEGWYQVSNTVIERVDDDDSV